MKVSRKFQYIIVPSEVIPLYLNFSVFSTQAELPPNLGKRVYLDVNFFNFIFMTAFSTVVLYCHPQQDCNKDIKSFLAVKGLRNTGETLTCSGYRITKRRVLTQIKDLPSPVLCL